MDDLVDEIVELFEEEAKKQEIYRKEAAKLGMTYEEYWNMKHRGEYHPLDYWTSVDLVFVDEKID